MAYERLGESALDYYPCRYGASKLLFRGPRRQIEGAYCAVLGGTETYGKFIENPYPALVEAETGVAMVNFGCVNAGADVYVNDPAVIQACIGARVTVIQVTGAHNTSNRFYAVHPRRNDRFLGATPLLRSMYRQVDFTEFSFNRHMLGVLQHHSRERFALIAAELRQSWVDRMKLLIGRLPQQSILLWMAETPPPIGPVLDLQREPLLIDAQMIAALEPLVTHVVQVTPSAEARAEGPEGKVCSELEHLAARSLPGRMFHCEVALTLADPLERMI